MPLLDDQVVNRDRSKFYFTLLTKIDPEPEGFTTRRHTGLGRRERLIPGSYIQATSIGLRPSCWYDPGRRGAARHLSTVLLTCNSVIPTRGAGFLGGGQAIDELESLWMQWAYWCVRDVGVQPARDFIG